MLQKFFKYHGAGNDFLLADNREGLLSLSPDQVRHLCDRHTGFGADGVMLLERSESQDFRMVFYNPDGSGGMMCGNGGRCMVAFAAELGVVSGQFPIVFDAPDGVHTAVVQTVGKDRPWSIRLRMNDVGGVVGVPEEEAFFLDTGTRHLVRFVSGLEDYPVLSEGRRLRSLDRFAPEGVNVDFVELHPVPELAEGVEGPVLRVRTFEKGVEDETLACGTGIVASAVAAYCHDSSTGTSADGRVTCRVRAAIATLSVDFLPAKGTGATDIWLAGPAEFIGTVECFL